MQTYWLKWRQSHIIIIFFLFFFFLQFVVISLSPCSKSTCIQCMLDVLCWLILGFSPYSAITWWQTIIRTCRSSRFFICSKLHIFCAHTSHSHTHTHMCSKLHNVLCSLNKPGVPQTTRQRIIHQWGHITRHNGVSLQKICYQSSWMVTPSFFANSMGHNKIRVIWLPYSSVTSLTYT